MSAKVVLLHSHGGAASQRPASRSDASIMPEEPKDVPAMVKQYREREPKPSPPPAPVTPKPEWRPLVTVRMGEKVEAR